MSVDASPKVIIQMAPAVLLLIGAALEMQGRVRELYGPSYNWEPTHAQRRYSSVVWASGTHKLLAISLSNPCVQILLAQAPVTCDSQSLFPGICCLRQAPEYCTLNVVALVKRTATKILGLGQFLAVCNSSLLFQTSRSLRVRVLLEMLLLRLTHKINLSSEWEHLLGHSC